MCDATDTGVLLILQLNFFNTVRHQRVRAECLYYGGVHKARFDHLKKFPVKHIFTPSLNSSELPSAHVNCSVFCKTILLYSQHVLKQVQCVLQHHGSYEHLGAGCPMLAL